ncbi:MAG: hypothetical protein CM15mP49_11210 [Actinomycetota bacterium]|nr:MAG: hypothetical protein CM15mP49_11210 [Actinomycetota bacterium]
MRTVVRRAERAVLAIEAEESNVMPYLNRLSDLMGSLHALKKRNP